MLPFPTPRMRRALRVVAVIAIGAGLGIVAVVTARRIALTGSRSTDIQPVDGWTLRGIRSARYQDGSRVLVIDVDEVALRHARLGMFGIGFAQRLEAHNARVDIELSGAWPDKVERFDIGALLGAIGGTGKRMDALITGARVNGLALRVHMPSGEWLEISAASCEASAFDRGHVVFRGGVHVRSNDGDFSFSGSSPDRVDEPLRSRR
mgnify:CR=1 FL=1